MKYNIRLYESLERMADKYDSFIKELEDPTIPVNKVTEINKQLKRIGVIKDKFLQYKKAIDDGNSTEEILSKETNKDMIEMAQMELEDLKQKIPQYEEELKIMLLPVDPYDDKNIIVEMRPAAGGDESGIFTSDLFSTYKVYCERMG
jgi:peptide chain release factor 1